MLFALIVLICLVAVELASTWGEMRQLRSSAPHTIDLTKTIGRRQ